MDEEREVESLSSSETIEEEIKRQEQEKREQEEALEKEASHIAYLNSIKMDEIPDETAKKIVQELLTSALSRGEKCASISRIITQSRIKDALDRASKVEGDVVNARALDILRELKEKGKYLSELDKSRADDAISILDSDLKKDTLSKVVSGLNSEVDITKMSIPERLTYDLGRVFSREGR